MKASIENIKNQLKALDDNMVDFVSTQKDIRNMEDIIHGENTLKDIIDDINVILKQLNYLVKSHNLFSRISTLDERTNMNSYLANMNSYIVNSHFPQMSQMIDSIKSILRTYNTFIFTKKDYISDLYEELVKLKQSEGEAKELLNNIIAIFKEKDDVLTKLENLEESYNELEDKINTVSKKKDEILELHSEAKSHKEIIDNFSKEVSEREKQLEKQEQKTESFENTLNDFTGKQKIYLETAEKLISSAKKALKYKTAEGISASIETQYDNAKNGTTTGWLWIASLFILMTLGLGIWLLWGNKVDIGVIIGRIALLPITIAGAIFSANQYVKQRNLIEDYAYKLVLTKSIVGFSEELLKVKDTNKGYQEYITKVLNELLQDPLRNKKDNKKDIMVSGKELKEGLSVIKDIRETVGE